MARGVSRKASATECVLDGGEAGMQAERRRLSWSVRSAASSGGMTRLSLPSSRCVDSSCKARVKHSTLSLIVSNSVGRGSNKREGCHESESETRMPRDPSTRTL